MAIFKSKNYKNKTMKSLTPFKIKAPLTLLVSQAKQFKLESLNFRLAILYFFFELNN